VAGAFSPTAIIPPGMRNCTVGSQRLPDREVVEMFLIFTGGIWHRQLSNFSFHSETPRAYALPRSLTGPARLSLRPAPNWTSFLRAIALGINMIEILTALLIVITGLYAWFNFKILKANERIVEKMEK
jgi:hypothetical protein